VLATAKAQYEGQQLGAEIARRTRPCVLENVPEFLDDRNPKRNTLTCPWSFASFVRKRKSRAELNEGAALGGAIAVGAAFC
jgi:hypothetical protein